MDFAQCPSIAPFFGFMGVAASVVLAVSRDFNWLKGNTIGVWSLNEQRSTSAIIGVS
jgi:hypothetical protein